MGIYLGQLPPAEIARFKAELAETIVANFCYPRFFDHRTGSLQTRPVDRTKRQEVWLYLSSVDFTAWSRVDLMSADFPHLIERLFIQFVQRNRSFFGPQGRRRMFDVRTSIGTCAGSVALRLHNHLTGQQITPLFGSPRPALSWTASPISGRPERAWEQIMASTMELQRQLQEWRGEIRTSAAVEEPVASEAATASKTSQSARPGLAEASHSIGTTNGQGHRPSRPQQMPANPVNPAASFDYSTVMAQQPTIPTPPLTALPGQPFAQSDQHNGSANAPGSNPVAAAAIPVTPGTSNVFKTPVRTSSGSIPASSVVPRRPSGHLAQSGEQNMAARQSGGGMRARIPTSPTPAVYPTRPPAQPVPSVEPSPVPVPPGSAATPGKPGDAQRGRSGSLPDTVAPVPTGPHAAVRPGLGFATSSAPTNNAGQREVLAVGEDDIAIFEQMRHQLVLWLRIEAISAGLEVTGQTPTQLLEMLRQQARHDETRLQVISTLLNLASQVMKTGTVTVLDYKQALMFHLMHTKRP